MDRSVNLDPGDRARPLDELGGLEILEDSQINDEDLTEFR